jgi:hypothetical protein
MTVSEASRAAGTEKIPRGPGLTVSVCHSWQGVSRYGAAVPSEPDLEFAGIRASAAAVDSCPQWHRHAGSRPPMLEGASTGCRGRALVVTRLIAGKRREAPRSGLEPSTPCSISATPYRCSGSKCSIARRCSWVRNVVTRLRHQQCRHAADLHPDRKGAGAGRLGVLTHLRLIGREATTAAAHTTN